MQATSSVGSKHTRKRICQSKCFPSIKVSKLSVKRTNDAPAIEADLALVACRVQDLLDLALAAHLLPEHRVPTYGGKPSCHPMEQRASDQASQLSLQLHDFARESAKISTRDLVAMSPQKGHAKHHRYQESTPATTTVHFHRRIERVVLSLRNPAQPPIARLCALCASNEDS